MADLQFKPNGATHIMTSPRTRLPLGDERATLSDAAYEHRLHEVRLAAGVREQLVEKMFDERLAAKAKANLGEVDEIVFGRDTDGSNKITLPGTTDPAQDRVSRKFMLPREKMPYLEVGEVVFGQSSPTGTRAPPPPGPYARQLSSPEYPKFPSPASARRYGDASPRVMGSYGALQQPHPSDDDDGEREQARFAALFAADTSADTGSRARENGLRSRRVSMPFGPTPASLGQPPRSDEEERRLYADLVDVRGRPLGMVGAHSPRKAESAAKGVRSQLPGLPLEAQGGAPYVPPLPPNYYVRADELGVRARGPHAGRRSHSTLHEDGLLTDTPRAATPPKPPHPLTRIGTMSLEHGTKVVTAPVGSFVDAGGSVRRPSGFPGRAGRTVLAEQEGGWKWNPEAHEAASAARLAVRLEAKRLQEPLASAAQRRVSGVDELVFRGEDPRTYTSIEAISTWAPTPTLRSVRGVAEARADLLHYVEPRAMPPPWARRHGDHGDPDSPPSHHQRTLTAHETAPLSPMHSLRRTTGMLSHREFGAEDPLRDEGRYAEASPGGKRPLPGPQAPLSARAVLYGDGGARARAAGVEDWVRDPIQSDIPDGHLGGKVGAHAVYTRPRHLPTSGLANGSPFEQHVKGYKGCDYHGRAEATSNVDEAMFGKTPQGSKLRQVNLGADFSLNRFGVCSNNPLRYD